MPREIMLTQGKSTIVDDADYELLSRIKWHAHRKPKEKNFYAISSDGRKMHRFILKANSHQIVDHINGDSLDNRRENLRLCERYQNCRNSTKRVGNKSGYKGVFFRKDNGKFRAQIGVRENGSPRYINLGHFNSAEEAASAYDAAAKQYHGEFARLNFP